MNLVASHDPQRRAYSIGLVGGSIKTFSYLTLTKGPLLMKFLRVKHVAERMGQSQSMIYKEVASGRFPRAMKLGANSNMATWLESEVLRMMRVQVRGGTDEEIKEEARRIEKARSSA